MPQNADIPLLDHELTWTEAVYRDFDKIRASFSARDDEFDPERALRDVLGWDGYRLSPQADLSGPAPGASAGTAAAAASPLSSYRVWACTGTREAAPTSLPYTSLARRMRFPSAKMAAPW
jgi:hypothetical protein